MGCTAIVAWVPDAEALYRFAGPRPTWQFTVEQLREHEGHDGYSAWVVVDGSRVVGQFELTVTGAAAWLSRVIVDPEQRGRGLGRELVALAVAQAHTLGAREIGLKVIAGNVAAMRREFP